MSSTATNYVIKLARVALLGALLLPGLASAQAFRGEIRGKLISGSVAPGTGEILPAIPASVQGALKLVITQVCTSSGMSTGTNPGTYLATPSNPSVLLLPAGCTTFSPGLAWPQSTDVRVYNPTQNNQYITVMGILTDI